MLVAYVKVICFRDKFIGRLKEALRDAASDETGATVAEYALVLGLITVAVIGVLGQLGEALKTKIQNITNSLPQ